MNKEQRQLKAETRERKRKKKKQHVKHSFPLARHNKNTYSKAILKQLKKNRK
ncbi:hypothetical protein [Candidatus Phytoplasma meliae]|uniref:Uncharacterized protein n=1 Tax=Candidatus Phytoplasma meliae TaxID=1848402 RepID=A0ABS5CXS8_9MOLU|nr:hypothetical protein [Candidatus Phytoplasma meliae]MBP5835776.1 hypothetical protein [Candidatus Phytoplasma meliae]MBP5836213.1 hypothetical protein [Candidatus Phytoplasma meliae]